MSTVDEHAFITAYDAYAEPIFRHCYFRVYDRERARELMQETFTKAWEYVRHGKEVDNLRAFLYKVAHNACVNETVRKKAFSLDEMRDVAGFDPATPERSPEADAEASLLMQELGRLRPDAQELLTMRYLDGLPVQDIAESLGEKPNTITVRLRRATDELRKRMEGPRASPSASRPEHTP